MSNSKAFALKNSGLNEFLFAEVGTELNGSRLTILSVLARLGQDPWAEAARWARLPKTVMIDCLERSMSQMPLCPQARVEAHETATRLVLLLPSEVQSTPSEENAVATMSKSVPKWLPAVLLAGLAFGAAVSMTRLVPPTDANAPAGNATVASAPMANTPSIQPPADPPQVPTTE